VHADRRVVPADAAVAIRGIDVGDLVDDLGVRLEREEAVGEADRHEQLLALLCRKLGGDPAAVARRAAADVDRHVEDAAAHTADELRLPVRRRLKMQAAQHARAA
jgi:hypothetical protein